MRQLHSEGIELISTALSKAQGEFSYALKDCNNPFFKSRYSDLSSYWKACSEPLTKYGLSIIQCMDELEGKLYLITTLAHSSGQWFKSYMPIVCQKPDAQSMGSAVTYMRRYSLAAILSLAADDGMDDDGEKAGRAELINSKQMDELASLLDACDPDYVSRVWKSLKKDGIDNFNKITIPLYDRLKRASVTNMKEYQSKKEVSNDSPSDPS